MNCPRCRTPLFPTRHDVGGLSLEAQKCRSCTGHWFEAKDVATLEQTVEVVFIEWLKLPGMETQARTLFCPRCRPEKVMDKVMNERDMRVVMDVCAACKGVWLDYGELEAISHQSVFSALVDAVRFIRKS